jgi:hypothetical protein
MLQVRDDIVDIVDVESLRSRFIGVSGLIGARYSSSVFVSVFNDDETALSWGKLFKFADILFKHSSKIDFKSGGIFGESGGGDFGRGGGGGSFGGRLTSVFCADFIPLLIKGLRGILCDK